MLSDPMLMLDQLALEWKDLMRRELLLSDVLLDEWGDEEWVGPCEWNNLTLFHGFEGND